MHRLDKGRVRGVLFDLVALMTAPLMIPVYYADTHIQNSVVNTLVFALLGNVVLNVLFPVFYMLRVRGERFTDLGITTKRWWLAVLISLELSAVSWLGLVRIVLQQGADLLPQLLVNALIL